MAPSACRSWRCVCLLYWLFATDARENMGAVTLSYGAIGVSELEVRFFVVLAVCHQGAREYFVFWGSFAVCVGARFSLM